ncbi:MAG: PPOX class F420-dependent oxidoreductase [Solirubrobacterales bacterium]|nr:PPOX class F420-dependent oxidoreductase [Solirubrobacterales bacterium]
MPITLNDNARALLKAPNFCNVSTLREDGSVQCVPVWVDLDGDTVVLNTAVGRAWQTHLGRDPRVTLTILNQENPYEYVTLRGRVVSETTDGADDHIDKMAMKYMGVDSYPYRSSEEQRVVVRVEAEHVSYFSAG